MCNIDEISDSNGMKRQWKMKEMKMKNSVMKTRKMMKEKYWKPEGNEIRENIKQWWNNVKINKNIINNIVNAININEENDILLMTLLESSDIIDIIIKLTLKKKRYWWHWH